jgi:hypothetical protein
MVTEENRTIQKYIFLHLPKLDNLKIRTEKNTSKTRKTFLGADFPANSNECTSGLFVLFSPFMFGIWPWMKSENPRRKGTNPMKQFSDGNVFKKVKAEYVKAGKSGLQIVT